MSSTKLQCDKLKFYSKYDFWQRSTRHSVKPKVVFIENSSSPLNISFLLSSTDSSIFLQKNLIKLNLISESGQQAHLLLSIDGINNLLLSLGLPLIIDGVMSDLVQALLELAFQTTYGKLLQDQFSLDSVQFNESEDKIVISNNSICFEVWNKDKKLQTIFIDFVKKDSREHILLFLDHNDFFEDLVNISTDIELSVGSHMLDKQEVSNLQVNNIFEVRLHDSLYRGRLAGGLHLMSHHTNNAKDEYLLSEQDQLEQIYTRKKSIYLSNFIKRDKKSFRNLEQGNPVFVRSDTQFAAGFLLKSMEKYYMQVTNTFLLK